jgi:uncharacterized delta-60 repeat protein
MKQIKKYIFLCIFYSSLLFLTLWDGYSALHSLSELPSTLMESGISWIVEWWVTDILHEKEAYDRENTQDITLFPVLDDNSVIGSSYIVERKSHLASNVSNTIVTSELLEQTLIRNSRNNSINPEEFSIREASPMHNLQARRKIFSARQMTGTTTEPSHVMTFEFGISDEHLIFSEPVLLSADAKWIPDGALVDLYVLHAGDEDFNTSWLMTDPNGTCLSDGSASIPASQALVRDGKVSFYTCGASVFALGYAPTVEFPNGTVWSLSTQSDWKVILGWQFTTVGWVARGRVARVSTWGSLDTTFANPNANNIVYATAVQSDGKVLIWWAFTWVSGSGINYLARLGSNGTIDPTFNANITLVAWNQVRTIAIQSDGKILIGWRFATVGWVARNRIARLNTDGTLDATYNPNSNNSIYSITLQSDGRALVGWAFTTIAATGRNRVARLTTTWSIDATFNPNVNNTVWDIKLFSDNTIALWGQFTTVWWTARNRVAKIFSTGWLMATFNPNSNNTVFALNIDTSDNLFLGWQFTTVWWTARNRIAKVSSGWVLDGTFNPNASSMIYAFAKKQDGTMAIGWAFVTIYNVANIYLTYSNTTGSLDDRYNLGINGTVWSLATQSDWKVILGWQFTTVGWVARGRVARVSTWGSLDTTFANPNANNIVYATAVQSDGKVLIWWTFTLIWATARNYMARLNSDGTLDATFNPNITVVAWNQVRSIAIQSDGKIIIGWRFATVGWVARNRIARLNTDGTLDATYNPNSNNSIYSITLQSDGRALVGWAFTTIAATGRNRVARLTTTWSIDATFNPNVNNTVWDIKLFSDNTIALWGQFTTVWWTARNRVAKIFSTGWLMATFNPNSNNTVFALNIDTSDNLFLGWQFTTVWWTARNRIAKVSSGWVLDGTFNPNSNNTVYAMKRDIENNIVVWWAFTTMSGKTLAYFSWIGLYDGDATPPQILTWSMISGSLLPIGNIVITTTYTDTGAAINTAWIYATLERWSGATWWSDIASLYLSWSPLKNTSTTTYAFSWVPYGKYRYRLNVADIWWNSSTYETTFYIDAIEWEIDQDIVDIGDIIPGIQKNSSPTDEITITVRTVWAWFNLAMSGTSFASGSSPIVSHWTGTWGYGYEKYDGAYSGTLSNLSSWVILLTQWSSINTNGEKNIYTYRVQYGALVDMMQESGDYNGIVNFTLNLSY